MYKESRSYSSIWNKYRPVILQLMKASANGVQQYQLSAHEFNAIGGKPKSGYFFLLETSAGNATNNVAGSEVAKDLLTMLQQSKAGAQFMSEARYELRLDKQFVLHVARKPEPMPAVSPGAAT